MKIKALADLDLAQALQISSELTPAAAWNKAYEQLEPRLEFSGQTADVVTLDCSPNPFAEQTKITFQLPEAEDVQFSFYDATGRLVHSITKQFGAGKHDFMVKKEELGTTGLVFLEMKTAAGKITKRLVVLP